MEEAAYSIAIGAKTCDEILTDLTSVVRKEHADLKDWLTLKLAQQNRLLVDIGHSLGLLVEQQPRPQQSPEPPDAVCKTLTAPSPSGSPSRRAARARSEGWARVVPLSFGLGEAPASPGDSHRLVATGPSPIPSMTSLGSSTPLPMQVPEKEELGETTDRGRPKSSRKTRSHLSGKSPSMSARRSRRSDMDRAEWTRHLQKRVTQELQKKHLKGRSKSQLGLEPTSPQGGNLLRGNTWISAELGSRMLNLAESTFFQWASVGVIILNMIFIGYSTQVSMSNVLADTPHPLPDSFEAINVTFAVIYCVELLARLLAYGRGFAIGPDRYWNAFDLLLIVLSIADFFVRDVDASVGSLRVIRAMRMFRVFRIFRVMRYLRDMRLMVCSICQSLGALSWALLLLFMIIYVFTIIFMQGSTLYLYSHYEGGRLPPSDVRDGVELWFNSIDNTMYTLLASIVNGIGWSDAIRPLEHISMIYRWLFTFYVVFVVIGVLNVLTGIFVERACELSGMDRDLVIQTQMMQNESFLAEMKRIFEEADEDESGTISWEEFKTYLESDTVKAYLSAQQLDAFDATTLFNILSEGTEGNLSIEQFIVGCQRLRGMARSVDVVAVLHEARSANKTLRSLLSCFEDADEANHGERQPSTFKRDRAISGFSNRSSALSYDGEE